MKAALAESLLFLSLWGYAPSVLAQQEEAADVAAPSPASDETEAAETERSSDRTNDAPAGAKSDFGHGGQFSLRAALVLGYRMVLRYDESPYCREFDRSKSAEDQVKFCGFTAPLALDLGLGFAPLDFLEPFVWLRLGLGGEKETDTEPLLILGAGARIYTMSDSAFKIYVEPAVGFELEGGQGNDPWSTKEYGQDVVFHLAAGPQFDLSENVGLFVDGGITVGVLRAIHSSLELKAGIQARLP